MVAAAVAVVAVAVAVVVVIMVIMVITAVVAVTDHSLPSMTTTWTSPSHSTPTTPPTTLSYTPTTKLPSKTKMLKMIVIIPCFDPISASLRRRRKRPYVRFVRYAGTWARTRVRGVDAGIAVRNAWLVIKRQDA